MHRSRNGERHLWTLMGGKRSQSMVCELCSARNAFRKLWCDICKSHAISTTLAKCPPLSTFHQRV